MKSLNHPKCNVVLGAPEGWDQKGRLPCDSLAIQRHTIQDTPVVTSYWKPSKSDLDILNRGGSIALSIVGHTMAPVILDVEVPCATAE